MTRILFLASSLFSPKQGTSSKVPYELTNRLCLFPSQSAEPHTIVVLESERYYEIDIKRGGTVSPLLYRTLIHGDTSVGMAMMKIAMPLSSK